jgi:hypothetical protein
MTTSETTVGELTKKAAAEELAKYVNSPDFKLMMENEYKGQLLNVVRRAESAGRWLAGIAGLLILAVFTALLLLQYADIRTKQADLYEKYTTGNELLARINTQAATMSAEVQSKIKTVDEMTTRVGQLETRLAAAEAAPAAAKRAR